MDIDESRIGEAEKTWNQNSRFLKESFLNELEVSLEDALKSENWDADDKDAFELSMRKFKEEVNSVADALAANGKALGEAKVYFSELGGQILELIIGGAIAVVALTPLLSTPLSALAAAATVGVGMIMLAQLAVVLNEVSGVLSSLVSIFVTSQQEPRFQSDSPNAYNNVDFADITIDYTLPTGEYTKNPND